MKHLKYGGSSAQRTISCPAWLKLAEQIPQVDRTSAAAERGHMLHEIMERIYSEQLPLAKATEGLSEEDAAAIVSAYDMTEAALKDLDIGSFVCEAFMVHHRMEDTGGSADMLLVSETSQKAWILDYKFGHMPVTDQSQFKHYLMCWKSSEEYQYMLEGIDSCGSIIVQPAVSPNATITEFEWTDVKDYSTMFRAARNSTSDVGNPGDWCKFCPAATYCKAKKQQTLAFQAIDTKHMEQVAAALCLIPQLKQQINAIETEAYNLLKAGHGVTGYKLVAAKKNRTWIDPEAARKHFRHNQNLFKPMYLKETLLSPAQVENAIKAEKAGVDISDLVHKPEGAPTLAPEADKRPALTVDRANDFPDALKQVMKK